jgi:single-stranded DNA-binding protein
MKTTKRTTSRSTVKKKALESNEEIEIGPLRNPRNEVFLEGRVSNQPEERVLPSGDVVVEFRIVIDRSQTRGKKREVDTLDIAVWLASTRKRALRLTVDDWVSIDGAVRRRFWQAPTGLASRWQVEASQLRKL